MSNLYGVNTTINTVETVRALILLDKIMITESRLNTKE